MSHARLLSIKVARFKSYREPTRLELKPLTVLVGRNNSGKSTMVQALLLLKQTLQNPRLDVPLHLVGEVEALNVRELTFGWPSELGKSAPGPSIALEFESRLDLAQALSNTVKTREHVLIKSGIVGLKPKPRPSTADVRTEFTLWFGEEDRKTVVTRVLVLSRSTPSIYENDFRVDFIRGRGGNFTVLTNRELGISFGIEWDHFIPHLTLDRSALGPRDTNRIRHNLWMFRCKQPLDDLRALLRAFGFLGSTRSLPPSLYRVSASEPPDTVGASGEYAAEILHARREDRVHYLPPLQLKNNVPAVDPTVRAEPLGEAVNSVLSAMGLGGSIAIEDIKDVGFRLLFGRATLQHVGRGLTYLLPIIEYGLLLDPKRFDATPEDLSLDAFMNSLPGYSLAAMEEPEAHLHPKLQAQLAHWFVALARCGRNLIVETHSDHLVRRLRGLIARAPRGSPLEQWFRDNVAIVEVTMNSQGCSELAPTALTPRGDFERWPADFMDVATDEEREIYDAALDKPEVPATAPDARSTIVHDQGEEPEDDGCS